MFRSELLSIATPAIDSDLEHNNTFFRFYIQSQDSFAMPAEEFPKIALDSPQDLNHVLRTIKEHAVTTIQQHLLDSDSNLQQGDKSFQLAHQAIEKSLQEVSSCSIQSIHQLALQAAPAFI